VQSGEVDVLARNATYTISRDTTLGMNFPAINFFDGQGFMVRKSLNVADIKQLAGASICVAQGTTTEQNLADYFRARNLKYDLVTFATTEEGSKAMEAGRCDSFTTDASGLAGERLKFANPDEFVVLPEIISKEPLGPAVRQGDEQWSDIVRWTHYAMLNAEEYGVTQANVDENLQAKSPEIRRLLGVEGKYGEALGLANDWAYRIVKHVGNYGETYERHIGERSPLKIKRGLNDLWTRGGLQYAYPIR
jgi:general L-amino acid transport system substrate-binding protein